MSMKEHSQVIYSTGVLKKGFRQPRYILLLIQTQETVVNHRLIYKGISEKDCRYRADEQGCKKQEARVIEAKKDSEGFS